MDKNDNDNDNDDENKNDKISPEQQMIEMHSITQQDNFRLTHDVIDHLLKDNDNNLQITTL